MYGVSLSVRSFLKTLPMSLRLRSSSTTVVWLSCRFRCTSRCVFRQRQVQGRLRIARCVPFGCRQARDFLHHGRYGPEGQFRCALRRDLTGAVLGQGDLPVVVNDGYDGPDSASHCLEVPLFQLRTRLSTSLLWRMTWWLTFLSTRSDEFQLSFWTAAG